MSGDPDDWRDLVCPAHQEQYEKLFEVVDAEGWAAVTTKDWVDDLDCPDCSAREAAFFGITPDQLEYLRYLMLLQFTGVTTEGEA